MINDYLKVRAALSVRGSVSFLILSFSLLFSLVCCFSCLLLVLRFFLFQMTFLSFSWFFLSSSYASWDFGFKLQTSCLLLSIDSSRGRLRNKWLVLWSECDESLTW
jgi:hypothetical protein